jgi:hypothetical protein
MDGEQSRRGEVNSSWNEWRVEVLREVPYRDCRKWKVRCESEEFGK